MKIKINIVSLILFIELFILFPYAYIESFGILATLMRYTRLLLIFAEIGYLVLYTVFCRKKLDLSIRSAEYKIVGIGILVFAVFQFLITVFKARDINLAVSSSLPAILMVLAVMRSLRSSVYCTLKTSAVYFWIAIVLNFLTILVFGKRGLYVEHSIANVHVCYLLGVDNQFGKVFFPGITLICLLDEINNREKKLSWFSASAVLLVLLSYILLGNGTGSVVVVIFVGLWICYKSGGFDKLINAPVLMGIVVFIFSNIFFQIGIMYSDSGLTKFILEKTGKNITFSGRTYIWDAAVKKFWKSPIVGYGKSPKDYIVRVKSYMFAAHNVFLQMLVDSGIIGGILFCIPMALALFFISKVIGKHRELRMVYIGVFSTCIFFMMEVGTLVPLLMSVLIASTYALDCRYKKGIDLSGLHLKGKTGKILRSYLR